MSARKADNASDVEVARGSRRVYISQAEVPRHSLADAMRIAKALADDFAKRPTKPLLVAQSLGMSPTSGTYRMLCGASIGYGLTEGGYNAMAISLTPLGLRVVAPQYEGEDCEAMREAFLRPRIIKEFLSKYDNSRLPAEHIAINVLEGMGVPREACDRVLQVIERGAAELKLLRDIKGQAYVDLASINSGDEAENAIAAVVEAAPLNQRHDDSVIEAVQGTRPAFEAPQGRTDVKNFTIPLTRNRVGCIQVPIPLDSTDIARMKNWLDLMEEVLTEEDSPRNVGASGASPQNDQDESLGR